MSDGPRPVWLDPPDPNLDELVRRRQRGRAIAMGVLLGGLALLIFFVTIAKIRAGVK